MSLSKHYYFLYKESYRTASKLEDRHYIGIIADEVNEYMPCCINKKDMNIKIGEKKKKKVQRKKHNVKEEMIFLFF